MTITRVVIAEDEALIRLDLRESLVEAGYEVVGEAADGAEAVAHVRQTEADVVILDVMMPGVDGLTAAREIMADRLAAVVILTAYSQRELVEQARDAGAMAYLVKPFQPQELVPAIELAVARFRELDVLAKEAESLSDRLETRKIIDRAKGKLMDEQSISEQDSFRFLQQTAMSRRTSMKKIALAVLNEGLVPEPDG
ncbi:MAG: response regulator [Actinomycetia bacterium]|nr:response regulator [Actinomycetes bacterium]MCP5032819.1 response regulator [Actinomycetes bacterium]